MKLSLMCFLIFFSSFLTAQSQLFKISGGKKKVEIPFQFKNNFIVVEILFNRVLPLKFIVDTGAEYTILTKRQFSDLLGITYDRTFKILGADLNTELIAYLAKNIDIKIGNLTARDQNILVLDKDYAKFEEFAGIQIDGILGGDLLKNFVVDFNFKKKKIILYEPIGFKKPGGKYVEVPISRVANKPYIGAQSGLRDHVDVKMLIDTGAGFPLLFHTNTHAKLKLPENVFAGNIGHGLGGFIKGYMGRTSSFSIDRFQLNNIVTHFQDVNLLQDTTLLNGRNGIIGNDLLSRFDFIIDYFREKIYLKPNKKFKKKFKFDRSGLLIIASGKDLNRFIVIDVIKGSPAEKAGLKIGDYIIKVNGLPATFTGLNDIIRKLQGRVGKKIRLKVYRRDETMKFNFRLRDII